MKTLKLRIKDKHIKELNQLSGSVNFVWNYINALCFEHLKRTGKFFSAYDLGEYTKGSGDYLGLHSQTLQAINDFLRQCVSPYIHPLKWVVLRRLVIKGQ